MGCLFHLGGALKDSILSINTWAFAKIEMGLNDPFHLVVLSSRFLPTMVESALVNGTFVKMSGFKHFNP